MSRRVGTVAADRKAVRVQRSSQPRGRTFVAPLPEARRVVDALRGADIGARLLAGAGSERLVLVAPDAACETVRSLVSSVAPHARELDPVDEPVVD